MNETMKQQSTKENEEMKFDITYIDNNGFERHHYQKAKNDRDALVETWLNNKQVIDIINVKKI